MGTVSLSVEALSAYLGRVLSKDFPYQDVWITGEISGLKSASSGHVYFNLKDAKAQLSCVMWRSVAETIQAPYKEGSQVRLKGTPQLYAPRGSLTYVVSALELDGQGRLFEEYLRLKTRLEAEGLFDKARKKALPRNPQRVGVVTSPTGAVIRDICTVSMGRNRLTNILIYPSAVQGADAPAQLKAGIEYFNRHGGVEVILLARGGGSIEDLWAFNDEALVRAIAASDIPVVSAVGHESDHTLCDFVADERAATPSAGAERIWQKEEVYFTYLDQVQRQLTECMATRLEQARQMLANLTLQLSPAELGYRVFAPRMQALEQQLRLLERMCPSERLLRQTQAVEALQAQLHNLIQQYLHRADQSFAHRLALLEEQNPLTILKRGYALLQDEKDHVLTSTRTLQPGQRVKLSLEDGEALALIQSVNTERSPAHVHGIQPA